MHLIKVSMHNLILFLIWGITTLKKTEAYVHDSGTGSFKQETLVFGHRTLHNDNVSHLFDWGLM